MRGTVKEIKVRPNPCYEIHSYRSNKRFGFLQNDLIYRTLTVHLSAVRDVEWIPGLSCDFQSQMPRGALALAAAAVRTFYQ